jgi:hypothetical protein
MTDRKVKLVVPLSGVTLEATEASTQAVANRQIVETFLSNTLNFVVKYTTGATETSNTCSVTVWGYAGTLIEDAAIKADTANWIQIGEHAIASGDATFTATTFKVVGAAAATTYTGHFSSDICFPKIRFAASESGVATNKGTVTIISLIQ